LERGDIVEKPDMAKKRKLLPLFVIIIIFVIVLVFCTLGGIFQEWLGIHSKGLRFFLDNERYSVEYIERDDIEDCVLRFDFNDPEAATGQVVYEENGAEIVVTDVEVKSEYQIEFWFAASGTYDFKKGEGHFISPFYTVLDGNTWRQAMPSLMFQYSKTALSTEPVEQYSSGFTSATPEYEKLTNEFSISVSDWTDETENAEERPVEIRFCKLYETAWNRK
jgi:hypothetical protein